MNRINKFPEYRLINRDDILEVEQPKGILTSDNDELQHLIFAPDPRTGIPRSDLAIVMSKDSAPEVAQYIRDNLMQVRPSSYNAGDDADLALASVKTIGQSIDDYMNGLRAIVAPSSNEE